MKTKRKIKEPSDEETMKFLLSNGYTKEHPMKTIKEAAESAAKELHPEFSPEWYDTIPEQRREHFTGIFNCAQAKRDELAAIIARHFSDFAALRDAAERAEKWISADLARRREIVKIYLAEEESALYFIEVENELMALRGLLNTQPTKET